MKKISVIIKMIPILLLIMSYCILGSFQWLKRCLLLCLAINVLAIDCLLGLQGNQLCSFFYSIINLTNQYVLYYIDLFLGDERFPLALHSYYFEHLEGVHWNQSACWVDQSPILLYVYSYWLHFILDQQLIGFYLLRLTHLCQSLSNVCYFPMGPQHQ